MTDSDGRKISPEEESELAEVLDRYTDPQDPEFDPDFSIRIMDRQPQWFTDDQRARIKAACGLN